MSTYEHGLDVLGARGTTLGPKGRNVVLGGHGGGGHGGHVGHGGHGGGFGRVSGLLPYLVDDVDVDDYFDDDIDPEQKRFVVMEVLGEILGNNPRGWDNTQSYLAGDAVYFEGNYWRALRDVSPPFMPTLMDGDKPGSSDAWRLITEDQAYDRVHGDDITIGIVDLHTIDTNLNALKPVTVEIARVLLGTGQSTISQAMIVAKQAAPFWQSTLPGDAERKNVSAHLQWHADNIAKIKGVNEQTTGYTAGDDLKKYVTQAFIEANAVETGAAWLSDAWDKMWTEIQTKLAAIPRAVGQAAASIIKTTAGAAAEGAAAGFGIPTWALWTAVGATVLGVGYVAYKVKVSPRVSAVRSAWKSSR